MRISLVIFAAAANAAIINLDTFNEAISNANETKAPSDTEKWEELFVDLFDAWVEPYADLSSYVELST